MKGHVLHYSPENRSGAISGLDGCRYIFEASEWRDSTPPARGLAVDFEPYGSHATSIYRAVGAIQTQNTKNKIAAGLLAIFLGGWGIHKFYLGFTGPGLVYLFTNTFGWFLFAFLLWIPNIVLGIIAFVEGVIYLTKPDEVFEQDYVVERKQWF